MKKITLVFCLLAVLFAQAQYTGPGFYRIHNVGSDRYLSIKGTKYNKTSNPDAFWPCVKMEYAPDQVSDAGSIIYIPDTVEHNLYGQGVSTYSLTHLPLIVAPAKKNVGGKATYVARTYYQGVPTIFRDYGNGFTAGTIELDACRWWIEPVNEESIETSYFGLIPVNATSDDVDTEYWTTLCCDFPCLIPEGGGVEGAYTIKNISVTQDNIAKTKPVKICGQGEVIPAATPVIIKCTAPDVASNKLVPVGEIANRTEMPITSDLLMGNYFSLFTNHGHLTDYTIMKDYIPEQSTPASSNYLALGVDENGVIGFFPKEEGTYMDANTAWLDLSFLASNNNVTGVYFVSEGDANGDGECDTDDLRILISYLVNGNSARSNNPVIIDALDMDNNGSIDMADLAMMFRYLSAQE